MKLVGKIVHGESRGRGMGFPTINIEGDFPLEHGVYAAWVHVDGQKFRGAMSYGPRPTFDDDRALLEVYLLDFSGDLYEKEAEVQPVEKIRNIEKFPSAEALQEQIKNDVEKIRALLL